MTDIAHRPAEEKSFDLRAAIDILKQYEGEYIETSEPVDSAAELSGVYRYIGAGGTVMRPTRTGPAMVFNKVKGYEDFRVLIGLLASRQRVARLLGVPKENLANLLRESVHRAIAPVVIPNERALCQEVVHLASDEGFDIRTLLPAPTNTPEDAGPYFTLGMCYAADPETGKHDVTIHRLCVQGKDEISMYFVQGVISISSASKRNRLATRCLSPSVSAWIRQLKSAPASSRLRRRWASMSWPSPAGCADAR